MTAARDRQEARGRGGGEELEAGIDETVFADGAFVESSAAHAAQC